jgi:AraC-like DNA-binding protein
MRNADPASPTPFPRGAVSPVHYTPAAGYGLDVELFPVPELRRRVLAVEGRGVERIDFLCLLYVSAGRYTHMVDFETLECSAGSVLILQPGQVHRFGDMAGWNGWLLVSRSDLLPSTQASPSRQDLDLVQDAADLPVHLHVAGDVRQAVTGSFERMAADSTWPAPVRAINALLRHQLQALLIRLHLAHAVAARAPAIEPALLQRFRRFRTTVEREHRRWHTLAPYAKQLGCSEKSLSRATLAVTGVGAKTFLTNRIVLEARRLLVHTTSPVATISDLLGFDEATNFVKYFRRETGETPGAFRAHPMAR